MTTNTEQLLREAASEALLTLDGIADTNPRDRADFENKDEWITWAKSRAKWAADKLRAPISRELLAERVLKQMLEQDAALTQPAQPAEPVTQGVGNPSKWEHAEYWMSLAWELCADECGEDACTELVWEGGPIPEPWGDRWMKYEDEAKRLIALVRKHVPAQPAQAGEPDAYLHDDGFWTAAKTDAGRQLNDRLLFAGSPKIGVFTTPPASQELLLKLAAIAAECSDQDTTDALDQLIAATPASQEQAAQAWDEGYHQGVADERTSEANIGVAGFGAKVEPARQNPYRTTSSTRQEQAKWCEHVASAVDCWVRNAWMGYFAKDQDAQIKAIAGIIERRLWALKREANQEQAQQPSLICRTCGADRFKEPCKNSTTCTMVGEAQAQQPTPASAADMAVYQSIADGYLNAQQPSGGEVVKPLFAASVAARKWAELQADGHRMQSIAFDGGKGGPGTITPWGKVMWGATTKPEPMTAEQIVAIAATPCAIPGSYVYSLVRAVEAHHDITSTSTKGEA